MEGEREERQLAHGRAGIVLGPIPQEVHEGRPHALDEPVETEIWRGLIVFSNGTRDIVGGSATVFTAAADVVARCLDEEEDGGTGDHHGDVKQPDV